MTSRSFHNCALNDTDEQIERLGGWVCSWLFVVWHLKQHFTGDPGRPAEPLGRVCRNWCYVSSRLLKSLEGGGPLTKCPYLSDTGFLLLSLMDSWSLGSRLLLGCPPCFLPQWLTPPAPEFASPRRMSPDFQLLWMLDRSALQSHAGCVCKQVRAQLSPFPANLQPADGLRFGPWSGPWPLLFFSLPTLPHQACASNFWAPPSVSSPLRFSLLPARPGPQWDRGQFSTFNDPATAILCPVSPASWHTQGCSPGVFSKYRSGWGTGPRKSGVAQWCLPLCGPVDYSLPGSSVHGILQARVLERVAISFSRRSSRPRDRIRVSCIAGRCFTVWATREAPRGGQSSCLWPPCQQVSDSTPSACMPHTCSFFCLSDQSSGHNAFFFFILNRAHFTHFQELRMQFSLPEIFFPPLVYVIPVHFCLFILDLLPFKNLWCPEPVLTIPLMCSFHCHFPWRRKWHPTPVFLPGKPHGQRSLVGYSLWGCKISKADKNKNGPLDSSARGHAEIC